MSSPCSTSDGGSSYQARLPNEVWALVWENLGQVDRIAVTHTCQHWRLVALAFPHLWQHVQVVLPVSKPGSSPGDYSPGPFSTLARLLERSRPMPFSFECHSRGAAPLRISNTIAEALAAHVARVAQLKLVASHSDVFDHVLDALPSLPSLTNFSYTRLGGDHLPICAVPPMMESLWSLKIDGTFVWPADGLLHLPALQQLSCPITTVDELLRIARSCPALTTLDLTDRSNEVNGTATVPLADAKELTVTAAAVQNIRDVVIRCDNCEKSLLPALLDVLRRSPGTPRRKLAVHSYTSSHPAAVAILADCAQAVSLSCLPSPRENVFRAIDSDGRAREVWFTGRVDHTLRSVRSHVYPSKIAHFSIYLRWWREIAPDLASMSGLQSLTLVTSRNVGRADTLPSCAPLPALRFVCLRSDNAYTEVTADAAWVSALLESICASRMLPLLTLSGISLIGELALVQRRVVEIVRTPLEA